FVIVIEPILQQDSCSVRDPLVIGCPPCFHSFTQRRDARPGAEPRSYVEQACLGQRISGFLLARHGCATLLRLPRASSCHSPECRSPSPQSCIFLAMDTHIWPATQFWDLYASGKTAIGCG